MGVSRFGSSKYRSLFRVYPAQDGIVGIFSMWYLVPVTYFDKSHDLSQLGSGHADTRQLSGLLPGTETTRSPLGSPRCTIPWISL